MILKDFVRYCSIFVRQSRRDNKNWELVNVDGNPLLRLTKTLQMQTLFNKTGGDGDISFKELRIGVDPCGVKEHGNEVCTIEYHVILNESYGVPMLLFNIYREYRGRMNMEEAWLALELSKLASSSKQYEMLTMVEHPLLFRPFLCLHPCRTLELLSNLDSKYPLITFLSTFGRFVSLSSVDLPSFDIECGEDMDECDEDIVSVTAKTER